MRGIFPAPMSLQTHEFIAVLNLKGAYPSVPRAKPIQIISNRSPHNLTSMVAVTLMTDTISTVGDTTDVTRQLERGVPEGSPLSPTLFNLFIHTLGRRLMDMPRLVSAWPVNFFADDVQLLSMSQQELQADLDICTNWADEYGLTWAPSKSCVLVPQHAMRSFELANAAIERTARTTYLEVDISLSGVEELSTWKRMGRTYARIAEFRTFG